MKQFLSCDWGTTAFRLRLIEPEGIRIIEEESTKQGIADTFQLWKQSGQNEDERLPFYLDIISAHIEVIAKRTGSSLNDLPLIISGMASSTIGMIDLPYKQLPVFVDGSNLTIHTIEASEEFKNKAFVISGVRTEDDVIRGEETKLVGCASDDGNSGSHVYLFPGTHPKHVEVENGEATAFKTYMTGEFFELLSKKSVLSTSINAKGSSDFQDNKQSFLKGVKDSLHSNLLHNSFLVRTNEVFKKLTKEENYYYLSGLLIGTELKDLISETRNITIVGNAALSSQYITALEIFGLPKQDAILTARDADEALIKGQIQVLSRFSEIF
jgi:2-dehydro-3-deoxygalactonokinase